MVYLVLLSTVMRRSTSLSLRVQLVAQFAHWILRRGISDNVNNGDFKRRLFTDRCFKVFMVGHQIGSPGPGHSAYLQRYVYEK